MDGIIDGGSRSESDRRNNSLFTTTVVQLIFFPLYSLSLCYFSSSSCSRIANALAHCRGKHPVEGETRNRLLFPFKLFFLPPSLPLLSLTILLTKKEKKNRKEKKLRLSLIPSRVSPSLVHNITSSHHSTQHRRSRTSSTHPQNSVPPFMAMSERSRKRGKIESWKEAGRRQDPPVPRIFHPLPLFEQSEEDLREGKTRQSTRWSHTLSVSLF